MTDTNKTGQVVWMDMAVPDATQAAEFYSKVIGWNIQAFDMGGYNDYCMNDPITGETQAGVCNARGVNADFPRQWMIYIQVDDLEKSLEEVVANGGKIVGEKKSNGKGGHYCMIQDPAGLYLVITG